MNIGKKKGYNNKILESNTDVKIDLNRDINKDHKKLFPDKPKTAILKILTKKHNDEKLAIALLITGGGLIAYHLK